MCQDEFFGRKLGLGLLQMPSFSLLLLLLLLTATPTLAKQINFQSRPSNVHMGVDDLAVTLMIQSYCYETMLPAIYSQQFPVPNNGIIFRDFNPESGGDSSYKLTIPRTLNLSEPSGWDELAYRTHYYRTMTFGVEGRAPIYSIDAFGLTYGMLNQPIEINAPPNVLIAYADFQRQIKNALNSNVSSETAMPWPGKKFVPRLSIKNPDAVLRFSNWCNSLEDYGTDDPSKKSISVQVVLPMQREGFFVSLNVTMVYFGFAEMEFGDLPWFSRNQFDKFRDYLHGIGGRIKFPRHGQTGYRAYEPLAVPLQCGLGFRYQYKTFHKSNPDDWNSLGNGEFEHYYGRRKNGLARSVGKFWRAL